MGKKDSGIRRQKFLINAPFQLSFMGFMAVLALFVGVSFYMANVYLLRLLNQFGTENGLGADSRFLTVLERHEQATSLVYVGTSFVSMAVILVAGLLLSHRVAGPIHKIQMALRNAKPGEKISFRKRDYFKELAEAYNESRAESRPVSQINK